MHSTWLKKLPFFYGSELDNSFYVALALEMKSQLFAPLEIIIDIHHVADQVTIPSRALVLVPDCLGAIHPKCCAMPLMFNDDNVFSEARMGF